MSVPGPFRIGQLAAVVGLRTATIRYYEQIGLVPAPPRTGAGYRVYGGADAERFRFIAAAQRLGFSLSEIREILEFRERGESSCCFVASSIEQRLAGIDARIRELEVLRDKLASLQGRMATRPLPDHRAGYCPYIEPTAPAGRDASRDGSQPVA